MDWNSAAGPVLRPSEEDSHSTGDASSKQRFCNRVPAEMPRGCSLFRSLLTVRRPIAHLLPELLGGLILAITSTRRRTPCGAHAPSLWPEV